MCRCIVKHNCEHNLRRMQNIIQKGDYGIVKVFSSKIKYVYTVGLTNKNLPELLLMFDTNIAELESLLERVVEAILKDNSLNNGHEIPGMFKTINCGSERHSAGLIPSNHFTLECVELIPKFFNDNFTLKQIIFPDDNGKLPWHTNSNINFFIKSGQFDNTESINKLISTFYFKPNAEEFMGIPAGIPIENSDIYKSASFNNYLSKFNPEIHHNIIEYIKIWETLSDNDKALY